MFFDFTSPDYTKLKLIDYKEIWGTKKDEHVNENDVKVTVNMKFSYPLVLYFSIKCAMQL